MGIFVDFFSYYYYSFIIIIIIIIIYYYYLFFCRGGCGSVLERSTFFNDFF